MWQNRLGRPWRAALALPATDRVISYRPTPPGVASGGLGEVGAWEALAPRGRTGAYKLTPGDPITRPLVERAREVSILQDVLVRLLQDRQPQLLTVVSEPGLGKTRLVAELGRLVDQAPELVTWRAGRTPPYGGGAVGALAEVIKAHVGILDTDSTAVAWTNSGRRWITSSVSPASRREWLTSSTH